MPEPGALAITEQPVPVPARLSERFSLVAEVQKLYARIAKLQGSLESEREQAEESRRQELADLLEVADAFDRLLAATEPLHGGEEACDRLVEDIRSARRLFQQKLTRRGVQRIPAIGRAADPALMDVVRTVDNKEVPDKTVVEEVTTGYRLKGETLRRAKVITARHR
jgi:molecular chaperone GrpE